MDITLLLISPKWRTHRTNTGCLYFRGYATKDAVPLGPSAIHDLLSHSNGTAELVGSIVRQLKGFFSIIWVIDDQNMILVSDQIRSHPLFYTKWTSRTLISDQADPILQELDDPKMPEVAEAEFLCAGYTTGQNTLISNIKQTQAGEIIQFQTKTDCPPDITQHDYYSFPNRRDPKLSSGRPMPTYENFITVSQNCVNRMVEFANGRQILVPLSGGYDSRFLLALLRSVGASDVLTFSYGPPSNRESVFSKRIAEAFGYPWEFIEYSPNTWRNLSRCANAVNFQIVGSNYASLPHFQDWPAIYELVSSGKVGRDAVAAPGHTADFVSGGHIPRSLYTGSLSGPTGIAKCIIDRHYSNFRTTLICEQRLNGIADSICRQIEATYDKACVDTDCDIFEHWDWRERQTKYIVNSVRAYEQFGLDWWMPFWDIDFVNFWNDVPLKMRTERNWYISCVNNFCSSLQPALKPLPNASDSPTVIQLIKRAVESLGLKRLALRIRDVLPLSINGNSHPLFYDKLLSDYSMPLLKTPGVNVIGALSSQYLCGLRFLTRDSEG